MLILQGVFDLSFASPVADKSHLQFQDLAIPSHIKEIVQNLTAHHIKQMGSMKRLDGDSTTLNYEGIYFSHGGSDDVLDDIRRFADETICYAIDKGLTLLLRGEPSVGKKTTAGKPEISLNCYESVLMLICSKNVSQKWRVFLFYGLPQVR